MEYTQNYALRKPGLNEYANVGDLNFNADKIDSQMKKNQDVDGEVYDPTSTAANAYEAGDYVINPEDGLMYVCNDTTYGTWDATKWEHTTEFEELQKAMASGGESELADLNDVDITNPTDGQALLYDDTNDEWVNSDLPDADVTKTASGNPIEFEDGADAPLVKCTTAIQGNQDLHGYDKPWVGGAGKNKLNADGIVITYNPNNYNQYIQNPISIVEGKTYTVSAYQDKSISSATRNTLSVSYNGRNFYEAGSENYHLESGRHTFTFTSDFTGIAYVGIWMHMPSDTSLTYSKFMVEEGSTATAYEPYSNICPITAYNQSTISVEDENEVVQQTSTATFSQSIYQGNADFVGGEATCDWYYIHLGSLTWRRLASQASGIYRWAATDNTIKIPDIVGNYEIVDGVCDSFSLVDVNHIVTGEAANGSIAVALNPNIQIRYDEITDLTAFNSFINGKYIAYKLKTPKTEIITPTNLPLKSLFGYNHIESSTGDMEIEYFPSKEQPLIDLIPEASNMHEYSTAEHAVGTWIDGETIYEQTYTYSGAGAANPFQTTIDMTGKNLIEVIPHYARYTYNSGQGYGECVGSELFYSNSNVLNIHYVDSIPYTLTISSYLGSTSSYDIAFTLRYTKQSTRSLKSAPQEETKEEQVGELKEEPTEEVKEEPEEEVEEVKEEETKEEGEVNER